MRRQHNEHRREGMYRPTYLNPGVGELCCVTVTGLRVTAHHQRLPRSKTRSKYIGSCWVKRSTRQSLPGSQHLRTRSARVQICSAALEALLWASTVVRGEVPGGWRARVGTDFDCSGLPQCAGGCCTLSAERVIWSVLSQLILGSTRGL